MGCEPTKPTPAGMAAWHSRAISALTLPTSVTIAPAARWGATVCARATILPAGAASTTNCAPRTASSGVSRTSSHHGRPRSRTRDSGAARPEHDATGDVAIAGGLGHGTADQAGGQNGELLEHISTKPPRLALSSPSRTPRSAAVRGGKRQYRIVMSRPTWWDERMSTRTEEKNSARWAVIILCIAMAVGILLPFLLLWLRR